MIGILEARYDRRRMACEYKKPTTKKNKAEQSDEADDNSELSPRVPSKKWNPNPGKGKKIEDQYPSRHPALLCPTQEGRVSQSQVQVSIQ